METQEVILPEQIEFTDDGPPFVKGIVPGTLSGAEIMVLWERWGVFDVPWPQYDEIGEGKRFKDSTEYVQYLRQAPWRK